MQLKRKLMNCMQDRAKGRTQNAVWKGKNWQVIKESQTNLLGRFHTPLSITVKKRSELQEAWKHHKEQAWSAGADWERAWPPLLETHPFQTRNTPQPCRCISCSAGFTGPEDSFYISTLPSNSAFRTEITNPELPSTLGRLKINFQIVHGSKWNPNGSEKILKTEQCWNAAPQYECDYDRS